MDRPVAPLGHIVLIPNRSVFALSPSCNVLTEEATNTNLFSLWCDQIGTWTTIGWLSKFTYKYNTYRSKVHRNINVHTLLLIFFTYLNKTLLYYSRLMNTCHHQQILSFTIHLIGNLEVILYRVKIETSSGFLMDICLRSEM